MKHFILVISIVFAGCFKLFDPTEDAIVHEVSNANKSKKAILFSNAGNATVDNSLSVSVLDYDFEPKKTGNGNVFVVDRNHGAGASLDTNSLKLSWSGNDTLNIGFDKRLRTFKEEIKLENVTIIYKEF